MRGIMTALGIAATMTVAAPAVAQIVPAFRFDTHGTELIAPEDGGSDPILNLGYAFSLSEASRVTALGLYSPAVLAGNRVGIWDATGNLVSSTLVTPAGRLVGNYRYSAIEPLILAAGQYVIAGQIFKGSTFPIELGGYTTAPGYTWLADREGSGAFAEPMSSFSSYGQQGFALVNFSVVSAVPEPATWTMMILGFGGVGMVIRRRRKTMGGTLALAPTA